MPFYDYQCEHCGKVEEVSLPINADKEKEGPKCDCTGKKIVMKKLISAPYIIVAGRNVNINDLMKKDGKKYDF